MQWRYWYSESGGHFGGHYKCRGRQNSKCMWGAIFIFILRSWLTYNFQILCL